MKRIGGAEAAALFAQLEEALEVPEVWPSPAERAELRAALSAARQAEPAPGPAAPRRVRWRMRVVVVAPGVAAVLAAFALTEPLPTPVRAVAHGAGLPVDSVELAAARHDMDDLQDALANGDPGEIERSAGALRASVAELDDDEHDEIDVQATDLLHGADRYLAEQTEPDSGHGADTPKDDHREPSPPPSPQGEHGGDEEPGTAPGPTTAPSDDGDHGDGGHTSEHSDHEPGESTGDPGGM